MSHTYSGESATIEQGASEIEWVIRPYKEEDLLGIVSLENAVYANYEVPVRTNEEEMRMELRAPRSEPKRQIVVAEGPRLPEVSEEMPVGYGSVRYEEDEEAGERIYNLRIVVHRGAEGNGLEKEIAVRLMEIVRGYEADPMMKKLPKAIVRTWSFEQFAALRALWKR